MKALENENNSRYCYQKNKEVWNGKRKLSKIILKMKETEFQGISGEMNRIEFEGRNELITILFFFVAFFR